MSAATMTLKPISFSLRINKCRNKAKRKRWNTVNCKNCTGKCELNFRWLQKTNNNFELSSHISTLMTLQICLLCLLLTHVDWLFTSKWRPLIFWLIYCITTHSYINIINLLCRGTEKIFFILSLISVISKSWPT